MRRLTELHQELSNLSAVGAPKREAEIDRLRADIEALLDANVSIRSLCLSALDEVSELRQIAREPASDS
jgi:hypothetical protein